MRELDNQNPAASGGSIKLKIRLERLEAKDHAVRMSMASKTGRALTVAQRHALLRVLRRKVGRISTVAQWRMLLKDIRDETENMC